MSNAYTLFISKPNREKSISFSSTLSLSFNLFSFLYPFYNFFMLYQFLLWSLVYAIWSFFASTKHTINKHRWCKLDKTNTKCFNYLWPWAILCLDLIIISKTTSMKIKKGSINVDLNSKHVVNTENIKYYSKHGSHFQYLFNSR